jgi:hypothetical protein
MESMDTEDLSYVERLWERGQEHLAALRYMPAIRALESAEGAAWRKKDGPALARLYLPLLEARRQVRYQAAEGTIVICPPGTPERIEREALRKFLAEDGPGTMLLGCCNARHHGQWATRRKDLDRSLNYAGMVSHAARRTGRWIEALLLLRHGEEVRVASPGDAAFAAGLTVQWTDNPKSTIGEATDINLKVPLPALAPTDRLTASHPMHAMVRESLIFAWEALALKWQHRHPPFRTGGIWEEMAWLRLALRIDPACEPIAMRLMSLAETAGRTA